MNFLLTNIRLNVILHFCGCIIWLQVTGWTLSRPAWQALHGAALAVVEMQPAT